MVTELAGTSSALASAILGSSSSPFSLSCCSAFKSYAFCFFLEEDEDEDDDDEEEEEEDEEEDDEDLLLRE
jgi:hypothetical protein